MIPGWGGSPGVGNGKPPQYSCLGNSMKGGAWPSTVHGVAKNQTQLSDSHTYIEAFHEFQLAWRVVKSDWNRKTEHLYCTEKGKDERENERER